MLGSYECIWIGEGTVVAFDFVPAKLDYITVSTPPHLEFGRAKELNL